MRAHGTRSSALFDIASWMGELPFEYPKSMSDGSTAAAAHGTGPSHSLSRWCSCRALWSSVYDRGQRRAAQRRPLAVCSVEYGLFWLLFLARGPRIRPARACGSSSAAAAAQRKGRQAADPLAVLLFLLRGVPGWIACASGRVQQDQAPGPV